MNMKKQKKEVYEEEIQKLEKMVSIEYLSILSSEVKEKLNILFLDKKRWIALMKTEKQCIRRRN